MQLPAVREALEAPPTSLEAAAVQAGQQQRRAQLKMAVMDQLYTLAMAGNARAQIRFLAAHSRKRIRDYFDALHGRASAPSISSRPHS